MYSYVTKSDLKNATDVDASQFSKISYLASLKSGVDELDIDKLAELDDDELKLVSVDLKKLSEVVHKKVKKDVCDQLVKKSHATDTSKLIKKADYDNKTKILK